MNRTLATPIVLAAMVAALTATALAASQIPPGNPGPYVTIVGGSAVGHPVISRKADVILLSKYPAGSSPAGYVLVEDLVLAEVYNEGQTVQFEPIFVPDHELWLELRTSASQNGPIYQFIMQPNSFGTGVHTYWFPVLSLAHYS